MTRNLEDVESQIFLAVLSAIAHQSLAERAWEKLNHLWAIEELDSICLRFLPAIYVNLGLEDSTFNQKVRGKYRYNTAKNIMRMKAFKPLLNEFMRKKIDYRVVKGFAISLRMNSLGYRIMSDIDLVIQLRDLDHVLQILSEHGFRDKFYSECENYRISKKSEKFTFINDGEVELDLHVSENAFPSRIFSRMFQESPRWIRWEDIEVSIPSDELLKRHSALHGLQSSGVTDRWQSLVDLNVLSKIESTDVRLSFWIVKRSILKSLIKYPEFAECSTDKFFALNSKLLLLYLDFWINKVVSHNRYFLRTTELDGVYIVKADLSHWRRMMYRFWQISGSRSLLEKFICKTFGGFLQEPKKVLEKGKAYQPKMEYEAFSALESTHDFRFRLKFLEEFAKVDLYFSSDTFLSKRYEIFANGKLVGVTPNSSSLGVSCFQVDKDLEVSFRNPSHSCQNCYLPLNELQVRFEY